jgi:O-antigen/teichoic acid export membrane protein
MGRDVLKLTSVRIVGAILAFIYSVILARTISQQEFGNVQYFINFFQLFALIVSGGFETTIVRFAPSYWANATLPYISSLRNLGYKTLVRNIVILSVCMYLLHACGISLPINDGLMPLFLAAFGTFITALSSIHRDLMRSFGWVYRCIWPQSFWRTVAGIVITLVLFWSGHLTGMSAIYAVCGGLIAALCLELLYLRAAQLPKPASTLDLVKEWTAFSRVIFGADIAHSALYRSSGLLIGSLFGLKIAALYYAADRIATLTQFIGEGVQLAAGPKISLAAQRTQDELIAAIKSTSILCFVSGVPMTIAFSFITPFILAAFGGNFQDATWLTIALIVGSAGYATFGPTPMIAGMLGLVRIRFIVTVSAVLLQFSIIIAAYFLDNFLLAAIGVAASIWFTHGVISLMIWRTMQIKTGVFSFSGADLMLFWHNSVRFMFSFREFNK